MRRWHLLVAALLVLPGLFGLTGSSWGMAIRRDPLQSPVAREHPELLGTSRAIRTDEWGIESPMGRVQQLATPTFPVVNFDLGLGHLQRTPSAAPVLDWGLAFRPLVWPLLIPSTWSHGVRWFLRDALLFAGLLGWFTIVASGASATTPGDERRNVVAVAAAVAVLLSSAVRWWVSTPLVEGLAFCALAVTAAHQRSRATARGPRLLWLLVTGYLVTCAFFPFYPPGWAPMLWVLCAALVDLEWRQTGDVRKAALRALPVLALIAAGVVLAILYYAPYLRLVAQTLYPGRRIASAGEMPWSRLLDLAWPSVNAVAPLDGAEAFVGVDGPLANVCEGSVIEATPLFLVSTLLLLDGAGRKALAATAKQHPVTVLACVVLTAWVFVPLPSPFGLLTLLRWSPGHRAWFSFGLVAAILTTALLAEATSIRAFSVRAKAIAVAVVAIALIGLPSEERMSLAGTLAWTYWLPIVACAALAVAGVALLQTRWGIPVLALSWALPLAIANWKVNPVLRSSDLFVRGDGHRAVDEALASAPGRLVDYTGYMGDVLAGFGWPVLGSVAMVPDLGLFRFLSSESAGLDESVYNRYAHVHFTLPLKNVRAMVTPNGDAFLTPLSPCSKRLKTLGVNHVLLPSFVNPQACGDEFSSRSLGDVQLWSRRRPVAMVGFSRTASATQALEFDYAVGAGGERARISPGRDALVIEIPGGGGAYAFAVNGSLVYGVRCEHATARFVDAHVVVASAGASSGRCELRMPGTLGALAATAGWSSDASRSSDGLRVGGEDGR